MWHGAFHEQEGWQQPRLAALTHSEHKRLQVGKSYGSPRDALLVNANFLAEQLRCLGQAGPFTVTLVEVVRCCLEAHDHSHNWAVALVLASPTTSGGGDSYICCLKL